MSFILYNDINGIGDRDRGLIWFFMKKKEASSPAKFGMTPKRYGKINKWTILIKIKTPKIFFFSHNIPFF